MLKCRKIILAFTERRRHDEQYERAEHMDRRGCRYDGGTRHCVRGVGREPCGGRGILSAAHAASGSGGGTSLRDPRGNGAGGAQGGGCAAPSGADTIRHCAQYGHAQPDSARCGERAARGHADMGGQPQCGHCAGAERKRACALPRVLTRPMRSSRISVGGFIETYKKNLPRSRHIRQGVEGGRSG